MAFRFSTPIDVLTTFAARRGVFLGRAEIRGVALLILILAAALFLPLILGSAIRKTNGGFGPDWDCDKPPRGEAICIRRPRPPAEPIAR
jgi:hypothetical protein